MWLVRPPRPITALARRFHRIGDADAAGEPSVGEVAHEMRAALAGAVLVAHNAHVDISVIGRELGYAPAFTIDTLKLARRFLPGEKSYRLGALVERLDLAGRDAGRPDMRAHRAAYDALMCARLLRALAATAANPSLRDLLADPPPIRPEDTDAPPLF
ncbi:Exodeoxyribonuclease 10 [Actinomadura rubteroloni]|uniref:Exodeoxyribonuclease 10 n=1 Tax=Actinomadura rubteroloni TaxID=1926885 RepID=A0A2P4UQ37_9ACTN|nr:Exodeoxyribonuclease 10 [Actinomadura rubteroloni]